MDHEGEDVAPVIESIANPYSTKLTFSGDSKNEYSSRTQQRTQVCHRIKRLYTFPNCNDALLSGGTVYQILLTRLSSLPDRLYFLVAVFPSPAVSPW